MIIYSDCQYIVAPGINSLAFYLNKVDVSHLVSMVITATFNVASWGLQSGNACLHLKHGVILNLQQIKVALITMETGWLMSTSGPRYIENRCKITWSSLQVAQPSIFFSQHPVIKSVLFLLEIFKNSLNLWFLEHY